MGLLEFMIHCILKLVRMFRPVSVRFSPVKGSVHSNLHSKTGWQKDCGLFAMAVCTFLAFGRDPSTLATHHFDLTGFRSHLIFCLENYCISEFP